MSAPALVLIAPGASAVLLLLWGRRLGRAAGVLGCLSVGVSLLAGLASLAQLVRLSVQDRSLSVHLFEWAASGDLRVGVDLRFDPLTAVMVLVVTGVGFLIHVYSVGYMRDDARFGRFFAYMNLFVFSMLLLVLADNLAVLYAGWELVGACSYLLIGFWNHKPSAATAAKKAFITTRIGDVGLFVAVFLISSRVGSLRIVEVSEAVHGLGRGTVTAIALLMFAGAVGKSAQVPLYVWLPDAMEGPTPVSALIHAATMVTAGVYLVVRMHSVFALAPAAAATVAVVGAVTALYAALLALAEEDIKRVLAYSTISQLGYMFLAAGIGATGLAIFHLVTHAFFKALLFLAAGSVMHGMHGETLLERMGGLRRAMPRTFVVTVVGWLAITGLAPFAGFFSKDAIVATAWVEGRTGLFVAATLGAALTAFYMSRMLFLAFAGTSRWQDDLHPHESPAVMVVPMAVLAALSVAGGALNLPGSQMLTRFLEPVVGGGPEGESAGVTVLLWALAGTGALAAWSIYGAAVVDRVRLRERLGPVSTLLRNKLFVDELYATLVVAPARLVAAFSYVVDSRVVDGAVNGAASVVSRTATAARRIQSGLVRSYALVLFATAAVLAAWMVVHAG